MSAERVVRSRVEMILVSFLDRQRWKMTRVAILESHSNTADKIKFYIL